ncbi:CMGA protein, partial [Ceuthmochares aereus]|nr:CMGA protein [Ceuthmochares aereus]
VMKCIVEVISDTLSKPNPLPISEECLETLRGGMGSALTLEGAVAFPSFLLLDAGANERTQQQKKNSGFEDELSEVLESQDDKNKQRGSLAELAAQKTQRNEDSREKGQNSLEEREPRPRDTDPGEEDREGAESNEIKGAENAQRDETLDNHIGRDFSEEEQQPRGPRDSLDPEDGGEQPSRHGQKSKEAAGERSWEGDPKQGNPPYITSDCLHQGQRVTRLSPGFTVVFNALSDNDDALGFGKEGQSSEEEEEEEQPRALRGGRHRLEDEEMQGEEDTFQPRDARSEEMEEESSREWEASKKWNKMDELAKQLTSKKRMEENESEEDPDRSMKMAFRSRKYGFSRPEEDVRRSWKHHSKEDSSEGVFPLVPMPEEKKDEEGSANRRTEDQELESLAAIEAELERVAHKLHELRRG